MGQRQGSLRRVQRLLRNTIVFVLKIFSFFFVNKSFSCLVLLLVCGFGVSLVGRVGVVASALWYLFGSARFRLSLELLWFE